MAFFKKEKTTKKPMLIGVHQIDGDISAIEYLQNADPNWVEGLFFFAKNYGRATFEWDGDDYEIIKNKNITYTLNRLTSEDKKEIMEFR